MSDESLSPQLAEAIKRSKEPLLMNSKVFEVAPILELINPDILKFLREYSTNYRMQKAAGESRMQSLTHANEVQRHLYEAGLSMIEAAQMCFPRALANNATRVIGIPEGGCSIALGVARGLQCEVQYSNQGTYADTNSPVLSDEELDSLAKEVFVVDDCIWQGRESNKLLPELRRRDYSIKLLSAVGDRYNARELRETVIFGYAPEDGFARIIRD